MKRYKIAGTLCYMHAENDEGFCNVEVDDLFECEASTCAEALKWFLQQNEDYSFFAAITDVDAKTYGKDWANFKDSVDESRHVLVRRVRN
jgi:hypothetical protein